jgi:hypothetical protein
MPEAWVECAFEGTRVVLLGRTDPKGGKALVYVDGTKAGSFDAKGGAAHRVPLFGIDGLKNKEHVLKVVAEGSQSAQKGFVWVDAVEVSAAP